MLAILASISLIAVMFGCAYHRASAAVWLGLLAIWSFGISWIVPLFFTIFVWAVWGCAFLLSVVPRLRCYLIIKPVLNWFVQKQPAISEAESTVLKAGGVWWEANLMQGSPSWAHIDAMPTLKLTPEEQAFLDHQTNHLCSLVEPWITDFEQHQLSDAAMEFIKKERFWGISLDKTQGGLGFSVWAHTLIITRLATRSVSLAMTVMVPNSLGPATFIQLFGTEEQKKYYLPRLACGEEIGCFALTSIYAGSDASAIQDYGIVCEDEWEGKKTLGIRLNFDKRYITLAPIATLIGLAFKLEDPQQLLGKKSGGITCALIPAHLPGIAQGQRHCPLHLGFLNGPISGKDVFVPLDAVIGGVDGIGKGWAMMMECLSIGRGLSLPSLASASLQICFLTSGAYARLRDQFKRPIGEFEGVMQALSKIGGWTYLVEAAQYFTALGVEEGLRPSVSSAIVKYHLTELARRAINLTMDVHGGRGIQLGPRNYLGSLYMSSPIMITVEGANVLTRGLIIFGQGLLRCHPYLQEEMKAAMNRESADGIRRFDSLFFSHVRFALFVFCRALVYGLSGGRWIKVPKWGILTPYMKKMTRFSFALMAVSEITLLKMGGKLKEKECLSGRLGDILSYLYLATSVVYYYKKTSTSKEEDTFAIWALKFCLQRIQSAWEELFRNYPSRWLRSILKWLVFPWGKMAVSLTDDLEREVANIMQKPSELRERLTSSCYRGSDQDAIGRLEAAFSSWIPEEADIIKGGKRLREMLQTQSYAELNDVKLQHMKTAYDLKMEALKVDAF